MKADRVGGRKQVWAPLLAAPVLMVALGCSEAPRVVPERTMLEMGLVPLHETVSREFVVSNPGEAAVTVRPRLEAEVDAGFAVLPASLVVDPGATGRVRVELRPRAGGPAVATLRLAVDDGETATVRLGGEGLDPRGFLARARLDFGTVAPGGSATRALGLANPTSRPVQLRVTPPPGAPVAVEPASVALHAGESRDVDVVYAPTVAGRHAGTLDVQWSDAHPPLEVSISAECRPPQPIVWSHDLVDFGPVPPGREKAVEVTLTNAGADLVEVRTWLSAAGSDGEPDPAFGAEAGLLPLKGGVSTKLTVRFAPSDDADRKATLRWSADVPDQPEGGIPLSGSGLAPWIVLPEALAVGRAGVGAYVERSFQIENRGTDTAFVIFPENDGAFATNPSGGSVRLQPGAVQWVTVRFSPTAAGAQAESLHLETTDPSLPSVDVELAGEGVAVDGCEAVLPDRIDLGHASVGETATGTLHLSVPGTAAGPCLASQIQFWGRDGGLFSAEHFPLEGVLVAPGESLDVAVAFTPVRGVDPAEATARLVVGDPAAPVREVALSAWAGVLGVHPDTESLRFSTWASGTDACGLPLCYAGPEADLSGASAPAHTHPDPDVQVAWAATAPVAGERCMLVRRGSAVEPRHADLWIPMEADGTPRSDPVRLDLGLPEPTGWAPTQELRFPVAEHPKVDVLVVMDDSLTDEGFWRVWDDLADDLLPPEVRSGIDFHLGVVAGTLTGSDVHTPGVLLPEPPSNRPRIVTSDLEDPVGTLFEHFRDGRPGDEAPWMREAMRMALAPRRTGPGGVNAGLLRPGVTLSVIFLAGSGQDRAQHDPSLFVGLVRRLGREGHPVRGLALVAGPDAGTSCSAGPQVTGSLAAFVTDHGGVVLPRCPGVSMAPVVAEAFGPHDRLEFPLPELARPTTVSVSVVGTDGLEREATDWETILVLDSAKGVRFAPGAGPAPGETVVVRYTKRSTCDPS